ncbi:MAG: hypothetical protein AAGK14_01670 [Verrucomicrobiota bacterium]
MAAGCLPCLAVLVAVADLEGAEILADLRADELALWMVKAAAVGALTLVVLKVFAHFKRVPPIEEELEELLEKLRTEINRLRLETAQSMKDLRLQIDGAHQRVDALTRDVNATLQRLPGDVVDLLNKTGAINGRPHFHRD